ncbi:MAG: AbrB/MazE/SpoVT family DNA-binding domain-containing protein [Candidatus Aminicenantales bacterium]
MKTRVQKWGNSLAVRIPKSFADDLGLENNSAVEMSLAEGTLVVKPDRDTQWALDSLLAEVTDENIHPAWETEGAAVGATDGSGKDGR